MSTPSRFGFLDQKSQLTISRALRKGEEEQEEGSSLANSPKVTPAEQDVSKL